MRAVRKKTFFVPPTRKNGKKKSFRPPKKRAEAIISPKKTAEVLINKDCVSAKLFRKLRETQPFSFCSVFFIRFGGFAASEPFFSVGFAVRFFVVPLLFGNVSALCTDFGSFRSRESRSCRIIRLCGIPVPTRHCAVREAHGASFRFRREVQRCPL